MSTTRTVAISLISALLIAVLGLAAIGATRAAGAPTATATSTTLSASPNPSVWCQPVTLTATVTPDAHPVGHVEFFDGAGLIAEQAVDSSTGTARAPAPRLGAGTHPLLARFVPDDTSAFEGSDSPVVNQVVGRAVTTTTLTSSQNPVAPGVTVTLTGIVRVEPPADPMRLPGFGGALQFTLAGNPVGPSIPLEGRYVGLDVELAFPAIAGTYDIGLTYSGDSDSLPSAAVLQQVVEVPTAPTAPPASGAAPSAQPQLAAMTATLTAALRRGGLAALTRTVQTFAAPGPGALEQSVYTPDAPRSALKSVKRVLVASVRRSLAAAGTVRVRLKATAAGRRAMKRARSMKLAIVTRFTPAGGRPQIVVKRLTVKARAAKLITPDAAPAGWRVLAVRRLG